MSTRTVHILSKTGDNVPSTGDIIVMLTSTHLDAGPKAEPVKAAIFGAGQPSQNITAEEEEAFRTVHAVVEAFCKGVYGQEPVDEDDE